MLFQVPPKLVPPDRSNTGKDVSAVQPFHVLVKVVPESNPVARKEVREVQPYHA